MKKFGTHTKKDISKLLRKNVHRLLNTFTTSVVTGDHIINILYKTMVWYFCTLPFTLFHE